jgi:hypothetical protein
LSASFSGTARERGFAVIPIRVNHAKPTTNIFWRTIMDLVSIIAVGFGIAYIALVIHTIVSTKE